MDNYVARTGESQNHNVFLCTSNFTSTRSRRKMWHNLHKHLLSSKMRRLNSTVLVMVRGQQRNFNLLVASYYAEELKSCLKHSCSLALNVRILGWTSSIYHPTVQDLWESSVWEAALSTAAHQLSSSSLMFSCSVL